MAEIARRLLFLWLMDDIALPQGNDYLALVDAATAYYTERGA